jgi:hypothetical protein
MIARRSIWSTLRLKLLSLEAILRGIPSKIKQIQSVKLIVPPQLTLGYLRHHSTASNNLRPYKNH